MSLIDYQKYFEALKEAKKHRNIEEARYKSGMSLIETDPDQAVRLLHEAAHI